jgi:hypothetical protein
MRVEYVLTTEQPDGNSKTVTVSRIQPAVPRMGETISYGDGGYEVISIDWKVDHERARSTTVEVLGYRKIDTGEGD